MAGPPQRPLHPELDRFSRRKQEENTDGSEYAVSESDHRSDMDWEPSGKDVLAELESMRNEEHDEAEESENDEGPSLYDVRLFDGSTMSVSIESSGAPANDAERKLFDQLRAKSEFRESLVRGALRFRQTIKNAESTADLKDDTSLSVDDNFDKLSKTVFIECMNGSWVNTTRGSRPSLRKLRENELATMRFDYPCACQICSQRKRFNDYYNFRVEEDRTTGMTRSKRPYKAEDSVER